MTAPQMRQRRHSWPRRGRGPPPGRSRPARRRLEAASGACCAPRAVLDASARHARSRRREGAKFLCRGDKHGRVNRVWPERSAAPLGDGCSGDAKTKWPRMWARRVYASVARGERRVRARWRRTASGAGRKHRSGRWRGRGSLSSIPYANTAPQKCAAHTSAARAITACTEART